MDTDYGQRDNREFVDPTNLVKLPKDSVLVEDAEEEVRVCYTLVYGMLHISDKLSMNMIGRSSCYTHGYPQDAPKTAHTPSQGSASWTQSTMSYSSHSTSPTLLFRLPKRRNSPLRAPNATGSTTITRSRSRTPQSPFPSKSNSHRTRVLLGQRRAILASLFLRRYTLAMTVSKSVFCSNAGSHV